MKFWSIGLVLIAVIFVSTCFYYYKRRQILYNQIEESRNKIDAQLLRRHDMIPSLVNTVRGYTSKERGILDEVTDAQSGLIKGSRQERIGANQRLEEALSGRFAVAEDYTDLKASDNFKLLQRELNNTEEEITSEKRRHNNYVLEYNNLLTKVPGAWAAAGHDKREFLEGNSDRKGKKHPE